MAGKQKNKPKQRFVIDFFEFSFLVEACIPPVPIARGMFWDNVINRYYHELTTNERSKLFYWINRNFCMEQGLKNNNEDCLLFNARYNPHNQYLVTTVYNGKEETVEAFKNKDSEGVERYYISKNTSVLEEYITKVEKIKLDIDESEY
jgi:hypothetical protein